MRWPAAWKDPSTLALLKGTPINYLLLEGGAGLGPVAERARQEGLETGDVGQTRGGVSRIEVVGTPIREAKFDFAAIRRRGRTSG